MIADEFSINVLTAQFVFYAFCVLQIVGFYVQMKLFLLLKSIAKKYGSWDESDGRWDDLILSIIIPLFFNGLFFLILGYI